MTEKNKPENPAVLPEADQPKLTSERSKDRNDKMRRIQHQLSTRDKIILLTICLNALSLLAVILYVTSPASQTVEFVGEADSEADVLTVPGVGAEITYEEMFQEIAPQYDLDWRLLARQAYRESGFDPLAVGKDNDTGLMQIIPSTWAEWAPKVGVSDPFDPYSNVLVAAAYLAFLREYFSEKGYPENHWMFVAYNWGPNNLRELLEDGGGWAQIPEKQRRYALDILQPASDTPPGWEKVRDEMVTRTLPLAKNLSSQ